MGRVRLTLGGLALCVAVASVAPAAASSAEFRPLDAKGPKLRNLGHSAAELRASLECSGKLAKTDKPPVLLLSGTTVNPDENFSWNWMPALRDAGYVWCASSAPEEDNMDDIQARGEYIVYAIRQMHRRSGQKIAIYGHSQGGMVGRWALRFWPNTRGMVGDVVGAAPSNQGTDAAVPLCSLPCAPSIWQQRTGADFIGALNSGREAMRGVSYTSIYSRLDQVVFPNQDDSGRSSLQGPGQITNVAVQDICPLNLSEHLALGTTDPVVWRLFLDAVTHPGPADPDRVPRRACGEPLMPGADPLTVATDLAAAGTSLATTIATYPPVDAEPPLRHYVFARG